MSAVSISVIVPVYNASEYLEQCLDSLAGQTMKDLEIIVIDDGSTDGSGSIADRFAEQHSSFRVYHQSNHGIGATRAKAIQYATGEYVGWVDADDFVEPNMYERLYNAAQQNNADVVTCDYSFYPEKIATKEKWFKMYQGQVDWYFIERNTQCWNKIVRRELLNELEMDKWYALGGDGAYLMTLLKAKRTVTLPDSLYWYRVGHVSLSNGFSKTKKYIKDVEYAHIHIQALQANGLYEGWEEYFNYRLAYAILLTVLVGARNGDKDVYFRYRNCLKELDWKRNAYTKKILICNHGKLKTFVLMHIIPLSYPVAHLVTSAVM